MADSDLQAEIQQLRTLVSQLAARLGQLEKPQGRLFLADTSNPGSTYRKLVEMIPNAAGSALSVLTDGRTVTGTSDPGVFLAIDALASGQRAFLGFANGTNAVYVPISEQLRYGVIQDIGPCNSYCTVKESDSNGNLLSDVLVSVSPAPGGCSADANGFCYTVGDIIAWMADPFDTTFGVQVGAYKRVLVDYVCPITDSGVFDLSELRFYNGDFSLVRTSTCGDDGPQNEMKVYFDGIFFLQYGSPTPISHVKVINLDSGVTPPSGTPGTDYADIPIIVKSTGTTNANVPSVGGSPCADASGPQEVKLAVRGKLGTTIDASGDLSSSISAVFNEDCTITITWNPPTMKAHVPI